MIVVKDWNEKKARTTFYFAKELCSSLFFAHTHKSINRILSLSFSLVRANERVHICLCVRIESRTLFFVVVVLRWMKITIHKRAQ